ncbi:MAG: FMN-binding glutamate synthase family protein, partial [Achromobacter mucicolens]
MNWIAGRFTAFLLTLAGAAITAALAATASLWWLAAAVPLALLGALGVYDLIQPRHAIRRNYPVIGNLRFLFEFIRPE